MADAFDSYTSLVATIGDWLNRMDLATSIPAYIALCEAEVNGDDRFRTQDAIVRATASASQSYLPLPGDYLSMQNIRVVASPPFDPLEFISPNQVDNYRGRYQVAGVPRKYTILGQQIEFLPAPDLTYTIEMSYYGRLPPLATNSTNWLLQKYPHIYLYGTLLQAAPYLKDDQRVALWQGMYEAAATKLEVATDRAKYSGSTIKMRTRRRYR